MSDSLWLHGLQHTRLPCPSLSPRICSNSCPLSWWCYLTISSSAAARPALPSIFFSIKVFSSESTLCKTIVLHYRQFFFPIVNVIVLHELRLAKLSDVKLQKWRNHVYEETVYRGSTISNTDCRLRGGLLALTPTLFKDQLNVILSLSKDLIKCLCIVKLVYWYYKIILILENMIIIIGQFWGMLRDKLSLKTSQ